MRTATGPRNLFLTILLVALLTLPAGWAHAATSVTGSKTDALQTDVDGDGVADPGDTIRYNVTITNTGGSDATGVVIDDPLDANTTLTPGTLNVSPIAFDDSYTAFGNTTLSANAASGVLANDTDYDSDAISVTAFDAASAQGGTVAVSADGSFSYTPPAGYTGSDTFGYTITDARGLTGSGVVTVTVSSLVWYVDNSAAGGGDGRSATPFNSLAPLNGAGGVGDVDAPGDVIYIAQGSGNYGGIELEASQQLIGSGAALVVGATTLVAAGTAPTLTHDAGINAGVQLASGVTVKGLDVSTSAGTGVRGTGTLNATLDTVNITGTGGATGFDLNAASGTLACTGGTVSVDSGADALVIDGGSPSLTLTGATLTETGGRVLNLANTTGGTTTFSGGSVTNTGGTGILVTDAAGTLQATGGATITITGATGTPISLIGSAPGGCTLSLSLPNASIATSGGAFAAVSVQNDTGNVALANASVTHSGGRILDVDTATGTFDLTNFAIANTDHQGVRVQNSSSSIAFPSLSIAGGTPSSVTPIELANNTGTYTFPYIGVAASGAGVRAFYASSGGTVSISGATNTLSATGGPAIELSNTTISGTAAFSSASSTTSSTTGISLSSVSGTLTVAGGAITNPTGTAVDVTGGAGTFSYGGTVGNTTGRSVRVANKTGGSVTLSGAITDAGTGILLDANTGATLTLSGGMTLTTTTNTGFAAINGGTVNVTGTNTVSTTTGTAVTIVNTTIGAGGVTFQSVSAGTAAGGPVKGIALSNTGTTGAFAVTGTGAVAGSGGTIQDAAAGTTMTRGVELINATNVSLSNMNLTNACRVNGAVSDGTSAPGNADENADENGAIYLQSATDIALTNVHINGSVQHGINGRYVTHLTLEDSLIENVGNANWESGLYLFQLRGTASAGKDNLVSNTTIRNTAQFNAFVRNNASSVAAPGAMDKLTFIAVTFENNGVTTLSDQVNVSSQDAANFQTAVVGCTFTATPGRTGDSIQADASGTSYTDVQITGSTFTNGLFGINLPLSGSSVNTCTISNNPLVSNSSGSGISVTTSSTAAITGTIANNTVQTTDVTNNGTGIAVVANGSGTAVADINGNTVNGHATGMRAGASGTGNGTAALTIRNNAVTNGGFFAVTGLTAFSGNNAAGESHTVCLHLSNNTIATTSGFDPDYLLQQYAADTFYLEGLAPPAGATQGQVEAFVAGTDTNGAVVVDAAGGSTVSYLGGTVCATP